MFGSRWVLWVQQTDPSWLARHYFTIIPSPTFLLSLSSCNLHATRSYPAISFFWVRKPNYISFLTFCFLPAATQGVISSRPERLTTDKLLRKKNKIPELKAAVSVTPSDTLGEGCWDEEEEAAPPPRPVSQADSAHDPWLSVTFRSVVPHRQIISSQPEVSLGAHLSSPVGRLHRQRHLAFGQSDEFGYFSSGSSRPVSGIATFRTRGNQIGSVVTFYMNEIVTRWA